MPARELICPARAFLNGPRMGLFGNDSFIPVEEGTEDGFLVISAELPDVDPDKDVELVVENGVKSAVTGR